MKKLIAILLLSSIVFSMSVSSADLDQKLIDQYNDFAYASGAPSLNIKDAVVSPNNENMYKFTYPFYYTIIETSQTGTIRTVGLYALNDAIVGEWLCNCMAWVSYLGKVDINSYGMLLSQFAAIHAGYESTPGMIGMDAFQIIADENAKYAFIYMNNDMKVND